MIKSNNENWCDQQTHMAIYIYSTLLLSRLCTQSSEVVECGGMKTTGVDAQWLQALSHILC